MKKRKVGFLFNIITICLAVVAIAVGVYSLQKSSLNISGSLGFTAHNVNARIDAYMYGYATEAGGVPLTVSEKVRLTETNGLLIHDSATSYSLNLGATNGTGTDTRYFSNLGSSGEMEDIVLEITVSNTSGGTSSPKNILANVDYENCLPISDLTDKIKIDYDRSAAVLETTNGKTQATFTFKISLLPDSTGSYGDSALTTPSNNVSLKMNLEETTYTQSQVKTDAAIKQFTTEEVTKVNSELSITNNKSYANVFPYYVEMGEVNNEKVKWLIVGTSTKDSDNKDQITVLTDSDKTPLSQGYMLQDTTYVMLSEKVLYTNSAKDYEISFQNKYIESGDCLNDYGYAAQDYATSNIRAYLTGKSVYAQSTKTTTNYEPNTSLPMVNIMTTYNFGTDSLYAKIKGRTLKSLYNETASNNTKDMLTVPTSKTGYTEVDFTENTQDKLWLMSYAEYVTFLNTNCVPSSFATTVIGGEATKGVEYLLRSSYYGNNYVVWGVSPGSPSLYAVGYNKSLRPAFLF